MTLDRLVVQELPFPEFMTWELAEKWATQIPFPKTKDPLHPEWPPTPIIPLDLSGQGFGFVHIKDESVNPSHVFKNRAAREVAKHLYQRFGAALLHLKGQGNINGNISRIRIPRLSLITAGNEADALSYEFSKYDLPPVKVLLGSDIPMDRLSRLYSKYLDVYVADLHHELLLPRDVKSLTNNPFGVDLTAEKCFKPQEVFYDWLVHESFNGQPGVMRGPPDFIFVPYGSGRLMENFLTWQYLTMANLLDHHPDPRLSVSPEKVLEINILGAKPKQQSTKADKLCTRYNPYELFKDPEISVLKSFQWTGKKTGIFAVGEDAIEEGYRLLSPVVPTEPSGAAGLGLYLTLWDQKRIPHDAKVLIVNTGKGV